MLVLVSALEPSILLGTRGLLFTLFQKTTVHLYAEYSAHHIALACYFIIRGTSCAADQKILAPIKSPSY